MKIEIERPHSLTVSAVKTGVNREIDIAKEKFGNHASSIETSWTDDILTVKLEAYGAACDLTTIVSADKVRVEIIAPLLVAPFKGKINDMMMFRLNRICGPL